MNTEASQILTPEDDKTLIQAELARLLTEKRFSGAPQMSAFLRYIVNKTLEGNADRIKAYSVGVDALGKPDSFDAQNDPSVRVLALRLRKTLSSIYESDASAHAIIFLRVGTYVPVFYKSPSLHGCIASQGTSNYNRGSFAENPMQKVSDAAVCQQDHNRLVENESKSTAADPSVRAGELYRF